MEEKSKKKVRLVRAHSMEYKEAAVRRMEAGESPSALGKELRSGQKGTLLLAAPSESGPENEGAGQAEGGSRGAAVQSLV